MMKEGCIRPLAVVVIRRGNQVLASPGYDKVKGQAFYRLPGGGVDFGETSRQAIEREIMEEFGTQLANVRLLEVIENIFTFNQAQGHEICFVYGADFADPSWYERKEIKILDTADGRALWVPADTDAPIYPQVSQKFIS